MNKERRKHTRIPIRLKASLIFPGGHAFHGSTENLSFGGAFINCEELGNTEIRGNCTLKLFLP